MSSVRKLGTPNRYTFIVDSDGLGSSLENCTAHVLRDCSSQSFISLKYATMLVWAVLQNAQDTIVNAFCQAHHQRHRSATKTLHAMTELWLAEMRKLIGQGVPRKAIIKGFRQAVQLCVENLQPVTLTLEEVCRPQSVESRKIPTEDKSIGENATENSTSVVYTERKMSLYEEQCSPDTCTTVLQSLADERKGDFCSGTDTMENKESRSVSLTNLDKTLDTVGHHNNDRKERTVSQKTDNHVLAVELKMTMKKENFEAEELDDVGWFFDDGEIPSPPQLDETLLALLPGVISHKKFQADEFRMRSIEKGTSSYNEKDGELCLTPPSVKKVPPDMKQCKTKTGTETSALSTETHKPALLSDLDFTKFSAQQTMRETGAAATTVSESDDFSCCLEEESDEFSSCFDNVKSETSSNIKSSDAHFKVNVNGYHLNGLKFRKQVGQCSKDIVSTTGVTTSLDDDVDEFDACFENFSVGFNTKSERNFSHALTDDSEIRKGDPQNKNEILDIQKSSARRGESDPKLQTNFSKSNGMEVVTSQKSGSTNSHSNSVSFEDKLRAVLKQKSNSKTQKCLAKSRHFRTIETAVCESQTARTADQAGSVGYSDVSCAADCRAGINDLCEDLGSNINTGSFSKSKIEEESLIYEDFPNPFVASAILKQTSHSIKEFEENPLQKLLAQKATAREISASKVVLNSRHFKTIENTMNGLKNTETPPSDVYRDMPFHLETESETTLCTSPKDRYSDGDTIHETCGTVDTLSSVNSCDERTTQSEQFQATRAYGSLSLSKNQVEHMVTGLSHGCQEVIDAVSDVTMAQVTKHDDVIENFRLKPTLVHCVTRQGPVGIITERGLIVRTPGRQLQLLQCRKPRKCLLLSGDVTSTFKHKGYKQEQKIKIVSKLPQTSPNPWLERVWTVIQKLQIRALLIQGRCDLDLEERCRQSDVVVITHVPYRYLQTIGHYSKCAISTYVHLCSQQHVSMDLQIEPFLSDWMDRKSRDQSSSSLAVIHLQNVPVTTTVFIHPVQPMTSLREEEFWHTLYRVRSAFSRGSVLKGGGQTEQYCTELLREMADKQVSEYCEASQESFTPEVYRATASGFHKYVNALSHSGLPSQYKEHPGLGNQAGSASDFVLDDVCGKTEAWLSACQLVSQIIQTDMDVVTGLHANSHIKPLL